MIIKDILTIHDIFYNFSEFIEYKDWISLSQLNKYFYERICSLKKINTCRKRFNQKFQECAFSRIHIQHGYFDMYNFSLSDYILSLRDDKIIPLNSKIFRNIFIDLNLHVGDIIFMMKHFIIDKDNLYTTQYGNENFLPKIVQKKFGLSRWSEKCENMIICAYVKINLEDFDFENNTYKMYDNSIIYVKIWNRFLQIYIITYIRNVDTLDKNVLDEMTKKKIRDIISIHRFENNTLIDPMYYEKNDLKIFTWASKDDKFYGWFLE